MPSRLGALVVGLAAMTVATPAAAEDFCAALDVPLALDLACTEAADGSTVVAARESPFATLNRLRVRQLDDEVDDPAAWLEAQMSLDTSGLGALVERWSTHPDNPIKPEVLEPSVSALVDALQSLQSFSQRGCERPRERGDGRWSMRCHYDASVAEGVVQLDLFEVEGGLPIATDFRAASDQRVREFEALVNGLRLD